MLKYKVLIYCSDNVPDYPCCGDPWYLLDKTDKVMIFDSKEEAETAGWKVVSDVGPWDFEVEEINNAIND